MNADTISIIISVVTVGVAVGALSMAGFRQLREDMDRRFSESREYMDQRFSESREYTDQRFGESLKYMDSALHGALQ